MTTTLFEKYRPKTFDEVLGQDKAIHKIELLLARGWGGRAWWISGASGAGKTTLARIIAGQNNQIQRTQQDIRNATAKIDRTQETLNGQQLEILLLLNRIARQ